MAEPKRAQRPEFFDGGIVATLPRATIPPETLHQLASANFLYWRNNGIRLGDILGHNQGLGTEALRRITVKLVCPRCQRRLGTLLAFPEQLDGPMKEAETWSLFDRDAVFRDDRYSRYGEYEDYFRLRYICHQRCGFNRGRRVRPPAEYLLNGDRLAAAYLKALKVDRSSIVIGEDV